MEMTGFADPLRVYENSPLPFDGEVHDYFYLWKWQNLDEENHRLMGSDNSKYNQIYEKVDIDKIVKIECILYSNPRWGTELTNKFDFFKSNTNTN